MQASGRGRVASLVLATSAHAHAMRQRVSLSDVVVIAPGGELDVARIGDFRVERAEAAAREPVQPVVVDLSSVSFIDSSGLGALLEFEHHLRRETRRLAVVAPQGPRSW